MEKRDMPGYIIVNYKITSPEGYEAYVSAVMQMLKGRNAELLVVDAASEPLDHPNALNNYQPRGMKIYDKEVSEQS